MSHSDVKRNQGGRKERARRTRNENDGKSGKSRDRLKARETLGQEPGRENMRVQRMAKTWGIFFLTKKKKKNWIELWSERRKTASWLYTITMKYPQNSYWYTLVPIIILRLQNSSHIPFSEDRFVWFALTKNSQRLFYIYMEWFCVGWRNFGTCH